MLSPRVTRSSYAASPASAFATAIHARDATPRPAPAWTFRRGAVPSSRSASGCASSSTPEESAAGVQRWWAPWRMAYIGGAKPASGCVFCDALAGEDDRASLVVHRSEHAFLLLNSYPYAPGHLMAVLNRHVGSLTAARPEELTDAMRLVQRAVTALGAEYHAEGFNVEIGRAHV